MEYDYKNKKIVGVLASNLEAGVALNVIGHLAISIGAYADPDLMGRPELPDGSGNKHIGISKYPVIITKVKPGRLRKLVGEARETKGILLVDYPAQMLETGHDDELAQAIENVKEEDIAYLGAMLYGERSLIDELTGKFSLWR